jgi:hypothetical protein
MKKLKITSRQVTILIQALKYDAGVTPT